jgi:hypothetical protein
MKAHSVTKHGILLSKLNFYGTGGIKTHCSSHTYGTKNTVEINYNDK